MAPYDSMHIRNRQIGYTNPPSRYNDVLVPQRSFKSLFSAQMDRDMSGIHKLHPQDGFVDETEALQEMKQEMAMQDQSGEGVLDIAKGIYDYGKTALGFAARQSTGATPTGSFLASAAEKVLPVAEFASKAIPAAQMARTIGEVGLEAFRGPVGTTISNVLSEKFNTNPEWRPGYAGESHLVLNTPYGLTRANYCGPGTNLYVRQARGDKGVSQIDSACEVHDMLYGLAKNVQDVRDADERLIKDVDLATDAGVIQKSIIKGGIRAKTLGEDIGLLDPLGFTTFPGIEEEKKREELAGAPAMGDMAGSGFGYPNQLGRFARKAGRDIRSVVSKTRSKYGMSDARRMGGNGLVNPGLAGKRHRYDLLVRPQDGHKPALTHENLMRLARRLRKIAKLPRQGNVKGRDPTISGMNQGQAISAGFGAQQFAGTLQGSGARGGAQRERERAMRGGAHGASIGVSNPNKQRKLGYRRSTDPMAMTDQSVRKAMDLSIRGLTAGVSSEMTGTGQHGGRLSHNTSSPIGAKFGSPHLNPLHDGPYKTADPAGGAYVSPTKMLKEAVTDKLLKDKKAAVRRLASQRSKRRKKKYGKGLTPAGGIVSGSGLRVPVRPKRKKTEYKDLPNLLWKDFKRDILGMGYHDYAGRIRSRLSGPANPGRDTSGSGTKESAQAKKKRNRLIAAGIAAAVLIPDVVKAVGRLSSGESRLLGGGNSPAKSLSQKINKDLKLGLSNKKVKQLVNQAVKSAKSGKHAGADVFASVASKALIPSIVANLRKMNIK